MRTRLIFCIIFSMKKQQILAIIACLLIVGGFVGYNQWNKYKKQTSFIQEIDRNLSPEDRKVYEDRLVEAEKYIAEAADNQAKSDALIYKAVQLSGLGQLALARDVFIEAANANPDNYNIYVHLYQVYFEMGDYKQAESSIKKSLELQPNNPDGWRKYILLEVEKLRRPEREIRGLYAQAQQAVKEKTDIYTDYARYLENIGDIGGAIEQWQKAQAAHPENYNLYEREIQRLNQKTVRSGGLYSPYTPYHPLGKNIG